MLGGGGSLFLGLLLESGLGLGAGVEGELGIANISNGLDFSGCGARSEDTAGDRSIYLELFHDDGASQTEDLWHLLHDLVESLLIQENIVVKLVLDLGLGPGLLLGFGSLSLLSLGTLGGRGALILSRLLCFGLLTMIKKS